MLAMRAANLQVAAGAINQAPAVSPGAFTLSVQTLGRLTSPEEFGNIVLRAETDGSVTRLRDVARIELGAQDYTLNAYLDNKNATALGIFQRPGSNALATSNQIKATMERLKKDFPAGLDYSVVYNPTEFIQASVDAVIETLFEALILVVIVVILFLQTWRAAIIPLLAIPVSLIGSFAVMAAVGISFNTLSLFGLVLAIGIVVDDAIVVVENVERYLAQGMSPKEAAHKTMDEVGGALIAISLVLIAVFLPTAFITGLQGTFYKQFAITIAASTAISAFVSLTLSPALAALLLKTHALSHVEKPKPTLMERIAWPLNWFFRQFNRGFEWLANFYGRATARLIRVATIVLVVYAGLLVLTGYTLVKTPTGLVPQLDRSYLIAAMQLPAGSTLERADKLVTAGVGDDHGDAGRRARRGLRRLRRRHLHQRAQHRRDLRHPEAVRASAATCRWPRSWATCAARCSPCARPSCSCSSRPRCRASAPAAASRAMCRTAPRRGLPALEGATWALAGAAGQTPGITQAFTLFNTKTPQIWAEIDRTKAEQLGVPIARVFETLSVYMGSALRQRLQHPRPHLSRDGAGRQSLSPDRARRRQPQDALGQRRDGADRLGRHLLRHDRPLSRGALQPLSRGRDAGGPRRRGFSSGQGIAAIERPGREGPALGLRLRMDRDRAAGEARRRHRRAGLRPGRGVRVPAAGRALRELAAAARRHPDRADVRAGGHDRRRTCAGSTATSWSRSAWSCWWASRPRTPS